MMSGIPIARDNAAQIITVIVYPPTLRESPSNLCDDFGPLLAAVQHISVVGRPVGSTHYAKRQRS